MLPSTIPTKSLNAKKASMVKNQYGERLIKVTFPYDLDTLYQVRSLIGREYHKNEMIWTAPIYLENLEYLQQWGFVLDDMLIKYMDKMRTKDHPIMHKGISGLKGTPRTYQYEGVVFFEFNNGRALLADEMGLGKTLQVLAWFQLHRDRTPMLIVTPAFLKLNWEAEANLWLPDPKVEILSGSKPWMPKGEILIINYDVLHNWIPVLDKLNIQIMVTDECHYYKNSKAKRTKAVKQMAKHIPYFLALSGTPIVNKPIEGYNVFNLVNPSLFPKFMDYAREFCGAQYTRFGWDFNGATNTKRLHKRLTDTIMLRRLKKDVLKELPDKAYSFVPLELDNRNEYNFARDNVISYIKEKAGDECALRASMAEVLVQYEILKKLAVEGIMKDAIAWIYDFLESGKKLIIFANHHSIIEALYHEFSYIDGNHKIADRVVKVDGSVSMKKRHQLVNTFQNNPDCRLFIGNIKAAGVGINLTAAADVLVLELPWTPGELNQAIDRAHRMGQLNRVMIYYLYAVNSIMASMFKMIDVKKKTSDAVLDGVDTEHTSLLYELINHPELI